MEQRHLGAGGPAVSAVGAGCWGLSGPYGAVSDGDALTVIDRALELGITMFDTADGYGNGTNEELLGRAMLGRRDRFVIASKFGRTRDANGVPIGVCGSPAYVRSSCEGSLRRLAIDTIDVYYYHRVDPDISVEETIGAMAELRREGKIRAIGISEATPEQLSRAHSTHPIAALQSEYSLFTRGIEVATLQTARALNIAVVAYSPLGRGMLGGNVRSRKTLSEKDIRRTSPRFSETNLPKNLQLVDALNAIARELNFTPAQIALAWLLARGPDIIPIPGTHNIRHLEENVAALEAGLTADLIARIEAAVPKEAVAGDR